MPRGSTTPLDEEIKKELTTVKSMAEYIQRFAEKFAVGIKAPCVNFTRNYLRYYATLLLDTVIDIEFENSFEHFLNIREELSTLMDRVHVSFDSIFDDVDTVQYANFALNEVEL